MKDTKPGPGKGAETEHCPGGSSCGGRLGWVPQLCCSSAQEEMGMSFPEEHPLEKVSRVQQVSEGELSELSATHTGRQKPA